MRQILLASAILLAGQCPGLAWAQSALAARIVTATGEAASGLPVRAENETTGAVVTGVSDTQGRVRFGGLSTAGAWRIVTDETAAFASTRSDPIALRSEFQTNIVVQVSPKTGVLVAETISVTRQTFAGLNTSNAEVSATLSAEEIARIPVEARSLERLLFRLPGVTQSTGFFGEAPAVAINGANALFTNYTIDGLDNNENFLGGQKFPVPVGAIQDVTVLTSSYSVEFGRTANGVVNVTTPSGGNDFKGEAFFVTRPGGFLSADPASNQTSLFGAPVSDTFSRLQGGFTFSGPILKDRTFFFLNAEYVRDQTDNVLSAPALGVFETLPGVNEQILLTGKIDHSWTSRLRTSLRVNHGRVQLERQGGGLDGGATFPTAGSVQDRFSTNVVLTNTYQGDGFDYVGSYQYSRFDWDFGEPLFGPGPQVSVFANGDTSAPIAVIGHPGFIFDETENTFQSQHKLNVDLGRHRIKVGVDLIVADFSLFGGGNVDGNFSVLLNDAQLATLQGVGADFAVVDLPADVQLLAANFETQPTAFGQTQRIYSVFAEDQWQITEKLALTLGLRWDYDNLTNVAGNGDFNNIAPRFAFNYTVNNRLAIRGGVGLFIEKLPYAIISDAIQQNSINPGFLGQLQTLIDQGILPADTDLAQITTDEGNLTVSGLAFCNGPGGALDCAGLEALTNLGLQLSSAERRIFNPFGLDNPATLQASIGAEWQVNNEWLLGVDGQFSRGRNLVRLLDLNSPEPFVFDQAAFDAGVDPSSLVRSVADANLTRPANNPDGSVPAGGANAIIVSDTGGQSQYLALIFKIQKDRGDDFYDLNIFYTLSRLRNDTDDINFRANDSNNFDLDFGPSLNDRTHVISSIFNLYPIENLVFSLAGLFQSGQPVNFIPDPAVFGTTDINGDGLSFSDQFTGNPDRFPGETRNSGRLPWAMTVDVGLSYRIPRVGPGDVEIRADFFNIFNTNNESGFPVNFTVSNQRQLFGAPFQQLSAGPPRQFQLSARYVF